MPQSSNRPSPDQSQPLGTQRVPSTIPISKTHISRLVLGEYGCLTLLVMVQVRMDDLPIKNQKVLSGCTQVSKCFIML